MAGWLAGWLAGGRRGGVALQAMQLTVYKTEIFQNKKSAYIAQKLKLVSYSKLKYSPIQNVGIPNICCKKNGLPIRVQ